MTPACTLDRTDVKRLSVLQRDGRIPNVELAEKVNQSPSPRLLRVKKLLNAGYSPWIDLGCLGSPMTVFTDFTLKNLRQIDFPRFQEALEKTDARVKCHLESGGNDFLVPLVTGWIDDCPPIVEALGDQNRGIDEYFSFVVLETLFARQHFDLMRLYGDPD
ncbi:Lrp/AsnC family transcriptional regulator [Sagittula sp. NFXS13]|uniref:Lrp/AsnC family transcriptional regulator n=1 Tax=Sagittula sp. NFXS13 TaxID=2819095 RepID=UPI0032DF1BE1